MTRKITDEEQLESDMRADLEAAYQRGDKIPAGWQPYAEYTDQVGKAIVRLPSPDASERDLLIGAGFNPDEWKIDGPIQARKWMSYDGRWLHYFKFNVVAGESSEAVQAHVDELVKHIRKRRPSVRREFAGHDAWAFVAADWQIGKSEGGDGTDQTVERVLQAVDMAKQQVKDLRRIGRQIPTGALLGLGDLVEGCDGFYPAQTWSVDRIRRDQGRITRELITHIIDSLAPLFDEFVIATVAGNHGEHRKDGKSFTTPADNDDVAAFEAVKEAYDRAGDYGLTWHIPGEELSMALELGGTLVGMTHGHMFRRGGTVQAKAHEYWKSQDFGMQALRDTQVLLSGHFHHLSAVTYGSRTAIQAPAMDPGSAWFRQASGEESPAGVLTLRFDAGEPLGFDDLRVLCPRIG
jgi:predicted phosphodiesterase